jgi:hypothetical protein
VAPSQLQQDFQYDADHWPFLALITPTRKTDSLLLGRGSRLTASIAPNF